MVIVNACLSLAHGGFKPLTHKPDLLHGHGARTRSHGPAVRIAVLISSFTTYYSGMKYFAKLSGPVRSGQVRSGQACTPVASLF